MSDEWEDEFNLKTLQREKEFFAQDHPLTNRYNFKSFQDMVILVSTIMLVLFLSTFFPYTKNEEYLHTIRLLYLLCFLIFIPQLLFATVLRKIPEAHPLPFLYTSFIIIYTFSILHNIADKHGYPYSLSLCSTVIFPLLFFDRRRRVILLSLLHLCIALAVSFRFKDTSAFMNDVFNCTIWTVTGLILSKSLHSNQMNYINLKERQLNATLEIEKAKNEAKGVFLAKMSHEIRTPINAVLGFDEMILREADRADILGYAENIKSAGKTLLSLINDILDFSKIEANKMEIISTEYELASMLNDIINMVAQRAQAKGLEFSVKVDETTPRLLYGDDVRIKQCMLNLLTNAIKYTPSGSVTLALGWQKIDDYSAELRISVKDTGIGIKEEDIGRLSTAFERIEEERNRSIEGTGLGLSIVRQLLGMMGSRLEVRSTYGSGSEFSFSVTQRIVWWEPVGSFAETYRKAMMNSVRYRESFHAPDARILVVDDTKMNLTVIQGFLKRTLLQVDVVENGADMLNYVQQKKYDVIFIDHYMPGMDGIEALHRMRQLPGNVNAGVPCIALTANAVAGAREMYLAEGFTDYLTKPVDSSKLEQMLLDYLPESAVIRVKAEERPPEAVMLPEIEGIDTAAAVANCGSAALFREIADEFCAGTEERASQIEGYARQRDYKNYTVLVHALKSSARLIGAAELAGRAAELEALGSRPDAAAVAEGTPALLALYRSLSGRLRPYLERELPQPQGRIPMTREQFDGAVADVKQCILAFDFDTAEEIVRMMGQYTVPVGKETKFQRMRKYIFAGDRDALLNLL